jgi:transcriptional regulator with XRE-family HTH domain
MLAGVSIDYYVRLERGRDRHPSPALLGALARVLQLDDAARAHLHAIANPSPIRRSGTEELRPAVAGLVASWDDRPAVVLGRHMDVLAANAVATALNPGFAAGTNLVRFIFLDERARDVYVDWDEIAAKVTATLRATAGTDPDDAVLAGLVDELSRESDEFRERWNRHEVREKTTGRKRFRTPQVGSLSLGFESFAVSGSAGQVLIVYHADEGSDDKRALKLLSAVAFEADTEAALR